MIAETVAALITLILIVILTRALITGRIEWGGGRDRFVADRTSSPRSFWTVFLLGLSAVAFYVWLLLVR